mgnify:FL=1|jgi:PKHD-type hydroxylase|tara:strand:+ start:276 stop:836 length:561 start_codon:yes stop_codon:yes gene_type:complete
MAHFLRNPDPIDQTWHYIIEDIFSQEQLDIINNTVEQTETDEADGKITTSKPTWLKNIGPMQDIYKHLENAIKFVNDAKFHFALDVIEDLQHLSYDVNDEFDWHVDCMIRYPDRRPIRKISCSILLNDDYEGGDFHFASKQHGWEVGKIKKNSALFFPSFMPHTVKPITKGNRQSLIVWARGPNFT